MQNQTILPWCSEPRIQLKTAGLNAVLSATSAPGLFPVPDLSKRLYTDFLYPDTPIQICVRERYHAVYISQDRKMKFGRLYTFEYVVSFDRICRLQTPDFVILKLTTGHISVSNCSHSPKTQHPIGSISTKLNSHHQIKWICDCWLLYGPLWNCISNIPTQSWTTTSYFQIYCKTSFH